MKDHVRLPSLISALDVRIATGRHELAGAFELVYRSHLDKGYIRPHPGRIVYRRAFGDPCSRTIIATTPAEGIVGTLTVVGDSPRGLQLETAFPSELRLLRERGRNECEITCLAVESAERSPPTAVFFALTKFMLHYANCRRYDDLLMVIHPRHYRFYWRHYRTYMEGSQRPYRCADGNLGVLCRIDLQHLERNMAPEMRQHYFSEVLAEIHYTGPPIKPHDHQYFCHRSGIALDADFHGRDAGIKEAA